MLSESSIYTSYIWDPRIPGEMPHNEIPCFQKVESLLLFLMKYRKIVLQSGASECFC